MGKSALFFISPSLVLDRVALSGIAATALFFLCPPLSQLILIINFTEFSCTHFAIKCLRIDLFIDANLLPIDLNVCNP